MKRGQVFKIRRGDLFYTGGEHGYFHPLGKVYLDEGSVRREWVVLEREVARNARHTEVDSDRWPTTISEAEIVVYHLVEDIGPLLPR